MKILLLSNNENVKILYNRLIEKGNDVTLYHAPVTVEVIDELAPELTISFNYRYIVKEDVIKHLRGGDEL